jgi:DNA polymerase alpha-associated DNA helicase A
MLTTQYRMHERIMRFASDEMYGARLVAAPHVAARLLCDLPGVRETEDTAEPVVFYDTQGGAFAERADDPPDEDAARAAADAGGRSARSILRGDSKSNEMEAWLVRRHVGRLVDAGVRADDIAVVTPYNAQVRWRTCVCCVMGGWLDRRPIARSHVVAGAQSSWRYAHHWNHP